MQRRLTVQFNNLKRAGLIIGKFGYFSEGIPK